MKVKQLFLISTLLVSTTSVAETTAPFGLTWGMSVEESRELGVILTSFPSKHMPEVDQYKVDELPKDLSNADFYFLDFDDEYGLQRITMASDRIYNDVYGDEGKKAYLSLRKSLEEKYGEPSPSYEMIGLALWKEADEFYQCLNYEGCGYWRSFFSVEDSRERIIFELKGVGRGEGYLLLDYQGPMWPVVLHQVDIQRSAIDSDAL